MWLQIFAFNVRIVRFAPFTGIITIKVARRDKIMDILGYKKRKKDKKTELRVLGKNTALLLAEKYCPLTGNRLDDDCLQLNVGGLENDLKNLDAQIAQLQDGRADLVELIADVKKATEKFGEATV